MSEKINVNDYGAVILTDGIRTKVYKNGKLIKQLVGVEFYHERNEAAVLKTKVFPLKSQDQEGENE